ncbi:glycosyltransferase [Flavicella sp.]|uniref:glycosyltransferase n=1 Tax=Flavicella sp. TaxID=2957742 RepID=UPI00301A778D
MLDYLLWAFYLVIVIQVIYYLLFLSPFFGYKNSTNRNSKPISVIICAKNEAKNLQNFLPMILEQKYAPGFEVVIINDRSTDNTTNILYSFAQKNDHLKIVNLENCKTFGENKKNALTLGIKASTHEQLLFTDADCFPLSDTWIEQMASRYSTSKNIVLGYGAYEKINNSFLNKIIRFETLMTAVQYFSYAKLGIPYMGVGRNLAYKKSEFFNIKGFIKHIDIKSGDDDLFINEVATSKNTTYNLNKESFTVSIPKQNLKNWIRQKRRHISTSSHYKVQHKFLLALFYLSQISFFVLSTILFISQSQVELVLILISIRYTSLLLSLGVFSKKLNEQDLLIYLPFLELSLIFLQLYIYLNNKTSTPVQWH